MTAPRTPEIRRLESADFAGWLPLWQGYLEFYKEELARQVTEATFARLVKGEDGLFGLVAVGDDGLLGIAHGVVHATTWDRSPVCYLEDLFVERAARGTGTARRLIEAFSSEAKARGAGKVYWHTQEYNGAARSLYDQVAERVSFVVYEKSV